MTDRRAPTALLAPSGLLAGHLVSATVSHAFGLDAPGLPHGTVELLGSVALPLALVALVRMLSATTPVARLDLPRLAAYQVASYTAVVGTQSLLHGSGLDGLAHDPVVWVGVGGQLVGALVTSLVAEVLRPLRGRRLPMVAHLIVGPRRAWRATASARASSPALDVVIRRRGPPRPVPLISRS